MIKRTCAFISVWLFAFSLLSNCYCLPAFAAVSGEAPVVSHCEHHASESEQPAEKKGDCGPRYQADEFESGSLTHKIDQVSLETIYEAKKVGSFLKNYVPGFFHGVDPPPVFQTSFFLLHHAFLI